MKYAIAPATQIDRLTSAQQRTLFERDVPRDSAIRATVAEIIEDVRMRGDTALRDQARRFDRVAQLQIEVPRSAWRDALDSIAPDVRAALEQAADNIAAFHRAQLVPPLELELSPGLLLGRRADPLGRVGVYAPGGKAAYASSVLMGVVPARVAGVTDVVVCSPPGPNGCPPADVLAACAIAEADQLFAVGGAGAIAALALGTDGIARVDKIVGPGNAYVTEAKIQLAGAVGTDCPAGPSEVLILADESADPELVAWELFAQAEHDPDACCVLATTSTELIAAVAAIIERELPGLDRAAIVQASLRANGALLLSASNDELVTFNARYAPEHLVLYLREADGLLPRIRNAGTIVLGSAASVVFGDYLTGANHVLPTGGRARVFSGLSVLDFVRWTTYQKIDAAAAARLSTPTARLAAAEGLPAHARAAQLRSGVRV